MKMGILRVLILATVAFARYIERRVAMEKDQAGDPEDAR